MTGLLHAGDAAEIECRVLDQNRAPIDLTGAVILATLRRWTRDGFGAAYATRTSIGPQGGVAIVDPENGRFLIMVRTNDIPGSTAGKVYLEAEIRTSSSVTHTLKCLLDCSPSALNAPFGAAAVQVPDIATAAAGA